MLPSLQRDYFIGKPVKLNNQDGFVVENTTQGSKMITIKLKSQPAVSQVS